MTSSAGFHIGSVAGTRNSPEFGEGLIVVLYHHLGERLHTSILGIRLGSFSSLDFGNIHFNCPHQGAVLRTGIIAVRFPFAALSGL